MFLTEAVAWVWSKRPDKNGILSALIEEVQATCLSPVSQQTLPVTAALYALVILQVPKTKTDTTLYPRSFVKDNAATLH